MKNIETDFWKIEWGPDEAKGDSNIGKYFLRIPEYEDIKEGKYRYIIGRKGTGKTAIIEQLINEISSEYNCQYKYLSLKNFPIQSLRNLKDRSFGDKSQFVPIWSFLIVLELCKLIIKDNKAEPNEKIIELKEFLNYNFPFGMGFTDTLKVLESQNNKVSVLPKWLGYENSLSITKEHLTQIHYQKATDILTEFIKSIKSYLKYFIFFDELDEGYSANDKNLNLLILALFRAVENTFLELKDYIKIRPVLALRSDIFDSLEDNDLNKLDDFLINLKWTKEYGSKYSLYELVNARINASLHVIKPENAWECVTLNLDPNLPKTVKSLWDFIYNRTFERPRDIVKFMKCCNRIKGSGNLDFKTAASAEADFSEWFFKEFRDEIQSHLSIWKEGTQAIIKLGKPVFTLDEVKIQFDKDSNILNYMSSQKKSHESILEQFFNFGLIGTLSNTNKWLFKYKDHNLPFTSDQKMILHFGFAKKFRVKSY